MSNSDLNTDLVTLHIYLSLPLSFCLLFYVCRQYKRIFKVD